MRYCKLGTTTIETSVVALGTWVFGGWMWGGCEEKESIDSVHAAIDAGINMIDTAPIYGFGLSEQIVGKALQGQRDKVVIATKCGLVTYPKGKGEFKFNATTSGYSEDGHAGVYIDLSPASIRQELECSLRRLKTDYIDLYQTHWQEQSTAREDTMDTLLQMKAEGKIRAIGVSNASTAEMEEYLERGAIDSDQECYSMLKRQIECDQLSFCRERSISVLAYSPLAFGLLTGKITPERTFKQGDLRADNPMFAREHLRKVSDMLADLSDIAQQHGVTVGQLAIAWTFNQPGLTTAICGARTPAQARENALAGNVVLSDSELDQIRTLLKRYEF